MEHVRTRVLAMGGLVEELLAKALNSLIEGDSSLGESVARALGRGAGAAHDGGRAARGYAWSLRS